MVTKGQQWYDIQVTVLARVDHPQWQGWSVESDGQTPWEGAQVVAFEVLSEICQEFGNELVNGPSDPFLEWTRRKPLGPNQAVMLW